MNRYWHELLNVSHRDSNGFTFISALPISSICRARSNILARQLSRKVTYPRLIKHSVRNGIAHILDQSYSDMLVHTPKHVMKVVTLHDLIPLRISNGLSPFAARRYRNRIKYLHLADVIVAVSEHTRTEAIKLLGIRPERIRVVPNGVRPFLNTGRWLDSPCDAPYILSIGSARIRKRLDLLPSILAHVRKSIPEMIVIRAGQSLPKVVLNDFHRKCGESSIVELGIVPDESLDRLYSFANAYLVTSSHEGFGLPILEAMARGCPVVTSNSTSLPEVGGNAALYFSLEDLEAAATHIVELTQDEALRSRVVHAGHIRVREFTWEKHFAGLLSAYKMAQEMH